MKKNERKWQAMKVALRRILPHAIYNHSMPQSMNQRKWTKKRRKKNTDEKWTKNGRNSVGFELVSNLLLLIAARVIIDALSLPSCDMTLEKDPHPKTDSAALGYPPSRRPRIVSFHHYNSHLNDYHFISQVAADEEFDRC